MRRGEQWQPRHASTHVRAHALCPRALAHPCGLSMELELLGARKTRGWHAHADRPHQTCSYGRPHGHTRTHPARQRGRGASKQAHLRAHARTGASAERAQVCGSAGGQAGGRAGGRAGVTCTSAWDALPAGAYRGRVTTPQKRCCPSCACGALGVRAITAKL